MIGEETRVFGTIDYVVFACMLSVSVFIGIYHACAGGKQKTTKEFLLADRNMNPIPVSMSLVATFISAVTVLGTPAEIYVYGGMYWIFPITCIPAGLFVARFTMPIFFRFECISANEYLEMRFNKLTRLCALLTFMVQMFIYMGLVIYAPALALNQVTGIDLWGSVLATGLVCTFYTTIGGMKAVLWTDVFQVFVMLAGLFAVIIEGCRRLGGMDVMWQKCDEGERLEFWNFDPDPTIRHSFWTLMIGGTYVTTFTYGINQAQVQRYLTCGTVKRATIALGLAMFGMTFVISLACVAGLTMYAYYKDCDPLTLGRVSQSDQLMPYFTLDLFGDFPGLPGLFTSAVFSGALSSVSSGLNALSAVTTEDFVKMFWKNWTEDRLAWISKGVALFYGLLAVFLAYVVSLMSGSILVIAFTLFGMLGGPLFGLFSLGMFFPWANSKGAVSGIVTGLALTCWIGIGANLWPPPLYRLPLTTDACPFNLTTTAATTTIAQATQIITTPEPWPAITKLYTISYLYYPVIGWCCVILVGLLVSFITGPTKPEDVDPKLFISVADAMYCCFPESCKRVFRCGIPRYEEIVEKKRSRRRKSMRMRTTRQRRKEDEEEAEKDDEKKERVVDEEKDALIDNIVLSEIRKRSLTYLL
ncbi:sodium-coupled monocarboxylate transporter 1-like [Amphiura filiformis]|uniref:sodium-coupled monocarboxylate transporter 1-like n=1 Tax=Amphiura filiformis TaxID=82378 RepID=UPI003B218F5F